MGMLENPGFKPVTEKLEGIGRNESNPIGDGITGMTRMQ
jgi:hypothetical protein